MIRTWEMVAEIYGNSAYPHAKPSASVMIFLNNRLQKYKIQNLSWLDDLKYKYPRSDQDQETDSDIIEFFVGDKLFCCDRNFGHPILSNGQIG